MLQVPNLVKSDLVFNERLTEFSVDIYITLIRFEIRYRFQVVLSTPTHIFYESPEFIFSTRQSDFKHSYHHLSKFISITQKNPFQNDFFHSGKGFYPFVVILFLQVHKLLTSTETYQNLYICSTKCST